MIDLSYFKFCMCEKVGGPGEPPEISPATVLYLFSYCIFWGCLMIDLNYFKSRMCKKVGGPGGTPRGSTFSYCFHYYSPLFIFCFPLYSFSIFHFIILFTTYLCGSIASD